jgi:hypothetical protein
MLKLGMLSGLDSAERKLFRATQHLNSLEQRIRTYAKTITHDIIPDPDGKETIHLAGETPPGIAILIGEVVYQIRSAMDHLAFDLVKLNEGKIQLPLNWEEKCCFPLWLKVPKKEPIYNCFDHILPGISKAAYTFIESVQPYRRVGISNALRLLAELSNVDKHRHLNVTIRKANVTRHYYFMDGSRHDSGGGGFEDGAQIEPAATDLKNVMCVVTGLKPYVTFEESTVGDGVATLEVENVLKCCLDAVETFIVPAFEKFIKNP